MKNVPAVDPDPAALVARGLAVFPLPPGGRRPTQRGWQRDAIATQADLRERWRPGDNIGVGCWVNRIVGLDLDVHGEVDGGALLAGLCAAHHAPWPDTFTVRTPSGGRHLYFRAPAGRVIGSASGARSPLGLGIDVRGPGRGGHGGYLVGPGSLTPRGRYAVAHESPIVELPQWLTALLVR
jgi:hypothetical protein